MGRAICQRNIVAKPIARSHEFRQPIQRDLGRPDCPPKIIRFFILRNRCPHRVIPPHEEGRTRRHDTWSAGCGGREQRCARERSQGGLELCLGAVSDCFPRRTSGVVAYGKTVWSWRPWLASSFAKTKFAQPGSGFAVNSQSDGGKRNSSPGRARHKPSKPLRREGRMLSAGPVCSCAHFFVHIAHETAGAARTRSSLRPLIPEGASDQVQLGRVAPRERAGISASTA